jgi:hypothetical protein
MVPITLPIIHLSLLHLGVRKENTLLFPIYLSYLSYFFL